MYFLSPIPLQSQTSLPGSHTTISITAWIGLLCVYFHADCDIVTLC